MVQRAGSITLPGAGQETSAAACVTGAQDTPGQIRREAKSVLQQRRPVQDHVEARALWLVYDSIHKKALAIRGDDVAVS